MLICIVKYLRRSAVNKFSVTPIPAFSNSLSLTALFHFSPHTFMILVNSLEKSRVGELLSQSETRFPSTARHHTVLG